MERFVRSLSQDVTSNVSDVFSVPNVTYAVNSTKMLYVMDRVTVFI